MKQINLLKQVALLVAVMVAFCSQAFAQPMNGTYTIAGTSPDYSTLSAAVSDLNSRGVNGPVIFNIRDGSYSGSSWIGVINNITGASTTNTITFRSQSGNKANVTISDASSGNYIFRFNNARYIIVKDLTLVKTSTSYGRVFDFTSQSSYNTVENCVLQAPATTTSSDGAALVYVYGHTGTDNKFTGCNFVDGGSWAYIRGNGTSSTSDNMLFSNNTFTATNSGYYGFYSYYTSGLKFLGNTFNRTGTGVYYFSYCFYLNNDFEFSNNTVAASTNSTMYGLYFYYMNYVTNSSTMTPKIHNNTITFTNTTGSTYPFYTYYGHYVSYLNNTVNSTQSSGYIYSYGPLYYNNNSKADGNTLNYSMTSSGYIYTQYLAYNGANWPDTFTNNTVNLTGYYIYNYVGYYGTTIITDNEYNVSINAGNITNYMYYPNGMLFARNKLKCTSTTGSITGLYYYGTTSYSGARFFNNELTMTSTTGTVYGIQAYYLSGDKIFGNVVTTNTAGANYTLQVYYNYNSFFKNNTFHSNATGGTDYVAYIYNSSSSYKTELKNNIFSKSSSNGYGFWAYANNFTADYNLYYVPGGTQFYMQTPSYNGASLQSWRTTSGGDKNSLIYQPPYINAGANDFRIDPSSPNAWAVNGRAEHDTLIKTDMAAVSRPFLRTTGVPDIGAYEVTPTSTPPDAVATPASPVANGTQVFTFGQDTVASIAWGASVPSTYTMRQYSGLQAAPLPAGVGRMYFYTAGTPATWVHNYKPKVNYKDIWLGTIPTESEAVIARSSNGGAWEGYNYTNAVTDMVANTLTPANNFDSVGGFTGVQNGRIGIRCVENPKGIAITNITAFVADIDWQAVFNPIGYQVILKTNSKAPTAAEWTASTFAPTNSLAAGGLTEDKKYFVFIRSICGLKDTSGYSLDSFETLITCHTPVITISSINEGRAVISWTAVKTVTKYEYVLTKSATPPTFGTEINKNAVLAPFLDDGTEYFVHVRAHCSSMYNISNWSSASFNTWKTGVENLSASGSGLHVYPNPVRNEMVVTIGGASSEIGTVSLLDMTGKVLKTQSVTGNKVTINVTELPAGMYMAQYTSDTRREQVKFNKQ